MGTLEASHYLRKLLCPVHSHLYLYHCVHPLCGMYLCGKIECIDQHFHDNHLSLSKVDLQQLAQKLRKTANMAERYNTMRQELEKIQTKVEGMLKASEAISKNIKKIEAIQLYLATMEKEPLRPAHLESI